MKNLSLLFTLLLFTAFTYAQSLPIDFESGVTTASFTDFDGGVGTVISNPQSNGINTSATVAQIVRNGGQTWAGSKLALANNIDFTTNSVLSMKVYTAAPVGTIIRFKLEEAGGSFAERDAVTTVTGAWETLTWDFTGTPSNFKDLVFMFDFGNLGDGSATSTFLFDDIEQGSGGTQVNLPIDFESGVTTSNFTDFDGGIGTVIPNPQPNGINTSATVAQIVRNGGTVWAGSKMLITNNLDFSTHPTISMKVYTAAPAGTIVKFKLETTTGVGPVEKDAITTVSNAWETLTWDFTGTASDYNDLVFMFDFGNTGDGSITSTFLFDDITQTTSTAGSQIDLPVTFESSSVNYTMTDFGGNVSTRVVDPVTPNNMVMEVVKTDQAELWAGTSISTPLGFATNIPLTSTDSKMTVRVWSPDANTPIRLKVENANDNTQTCETETMTTVAGGWEYLVFDFANEVSGTATLSSGLANGWTYSMASIFMNFGTDGATAGTKTYYFDDVYFGVYTNTNNFEKLAVKAFPNPVNNILQIDVEDAIKEINIFNTLGQLVQTEQVNNNKNTFDVSTLINGIYFVEVKTETAVGSLKIVKE